MTNTCHIGCPKSHRAPPSQAVMGFTGVDREVAEKAEKKMLRSLQHPCLYLCYYQWHGFPTQKSGPRGESMDHRLSCEQCAGQSGGWWRWWLRCGPNRVVTGEPVPCEMGIQVIAVLGWRRLKKMCLIHSWTDEKVMWGGDPVEKFRFFIRKELSHSIQGVWTPTKDQRKSEVEEPHDMYTLNQRGEQAQAPRIFVLLKSCILLVFKGMR